MLVCPARGYISFLLTADLEYWEKALGPAAWVMGKDLGAAAEYLGKVLGATLYIYSTGITNVGFRSYSKGIH